MNPWGLLAQVPSGVGDSRASGSQLRKFFSLLSIWVHAMEQTFL